MKKIIPHYFLFVLFFYFLFNFLLRGLRIEGFLYIISFIGIIIGNLFFIKKQANQLKWKNITLFAFLFLLLFSKNIYFLLLGLSTILFIAVDKMKKPKPLELVIIVFSVIGFSIQYFGIIILVASFIKNAEIPLYEHYRCEKHKELYVSSAAAFDSYHYNLGTYFDIIDAGNILKITYQNRKEVSQEEYEEFLNTHTCHSVQ